MSMDDDVTVEAWGLVLDALTEALALDGLSERDAFVLRLLYDDATDLVNGRLGPGEWRRLQIDRGWAQCRADAREADRLQREWRESGAYRDLRESFRGAPLGDVVACYLADAGLALADVAAMTDEQVLRLERKVWNNGSQRILGPPSVAKLRTYLQQTNT